MCRGTKGEKNICIFHCNPYNIWVGSVARRGFGELFLCVGLTISEGGEREGEGGSGGWRGRERDRERRSLGVSQQTSSGELAKIPFICLFF